MIATGNAEREVVAINRECVQDERPLEPVVVEFAGSHAAIELTEQTRSSMNTAALACCFESRNGATPAGVGIPSSPNPGVSSLRSSTPG